MSNGYGPDTRREKCKCKLCLGQEGGEITDPHTGEKYRARVTSALPLLRPVPGPDEWRVEPICEHCMEIVQRAAGTAGGSVRFYPLEESLNEARRRNSEMIRRDCLMASIVRHYARFRVEYDDEPRVGDAAIPDGGL